MSVDNCVLSACDCVEPQSEPAERKILLICTSSQSVLNFRLGLIKALKKGRYDVSVVALDGTFKKEIEEYGVAFYCVNDENRGINPLKLLSLKSKYYSVIKRVAPDIVFTFMLKPNLFGIPAAKRAGVKKIYCMVEGEGDVFINDGLKWKFIRRFVCKKYKKSFKSVQKVFFLNADDRMDFIKRKLLNESLCEIVPGVGVDLEKFAAKPVKNHASFLMIARMLKTKGVAEYCKAARLVKKRYPKARFSYLGAEGVLKIEDIQPYIEDKTLSYFGTSSDVRPFLEDCSVFVLPSYGEGMPMTVMEAEASGRAVIVTDVNGCKETVKDGYNGLLVKKADYRDLAEKMVYCIEHPDEVEEMCKNARVFAEENFDERKINDIVLSFIEKTE